MGEIIRFPDLGVPFPDLTDLEQERARVRVLVAYLDHTDPDWRSKIAQVVKSENEETP